MKTRTEAMVLMLSAQDSQIHPLRHLSPRGPPKQEFKLVVHVLSDPQVYIPLRPIPEVGSTGWGRHLRKIFKEGLPLCGQRLPWWVLIDLVVLLEIALAFVQTCVFVSPGSHGEFNDQPLLPGSVWFRLLTFTTVIFFLDAWPCLD